MEEVLKMSSFQTLLMYWYFSRGILGVCEEGVSLMGRGILPGLLAKGREYVDAVMLTKSESYGRKTRM